MSTLNDRLAAPRIVRHSGELLDAIRQRIAELETTHASVEEISGLQLGYISKITGPKPPKKVTLYIVFLLLQALGLEINLTISSDFQSVWRTVSIDEDCAGSKHVFWKQVRSCRRISLFTAPGLAASPGPRSYRRRDYPRLGARPSTNAGAGRVKQASKQQADRKHGTA